MLKKTLNLKGVKNLTKAEQKEISGGFWGGGCQPMLLECESNNDCPSCSFGCGFNIEFNGQVINFPGVCSF